MYLIVLHSLSSCSYGLRLNGYSALRLACVCPVHADLIRPVCSLTMMGACLLACLFGWLVRLEGKREKGEEEKGEEVCLCGAVVL